MDGEQKIEVIWFLCLADSYAPNRYQVGKCGVTEIKRKTITTELYCLKEYFRVYAGEQILADIYNPSEVYYFRK